MADNWRIQFAIADLSGWDWGDKAREAAVRSETGDDESKTLDIRVLADMQALLNPPPDQKAQTVEEVHAAQYGAAHSKWIVEKLLADPEKGWSEAFRGRPLTQNRLARALRRFKIFSRSVTVPVGGVEAKGYRREDCEEAWSRYL